MSPQLIRRASTLLLLLTWTLAACVGPDDDDSAGSDDDDSTEPSNDDDSAADDDDDLTPPCDEDADGDGYIAEECGGLDCDDSSADVNPDQSEICADGIDNDCDGQPNGCGLSGELEAADADATLELPPTQSFGDAVSALSPGVGPAGANLAIASPMGLQGLTFWSESLGWNTNASLEFSSEGPNTPSWLISAEPPSNWLAVADAIHRVEPDGTDRGAVVDAFVAGTGDQSMAEALLLRVTIPHFDALGPEWDCFNNWRTMFSIRQAQLRPCGDLTGDGLPDLCVGAAGDDLDEAGGGLAIFDVASQQGSVGLEQAAATVAGGAQCQGVGYRYAGGWDLTGDGLDDVAVGVHSAGPSAVGEVHVHPGPLQGIIDYGVSTAQIYGQTVGGGFGMRLFEALDVNDDGIGDLLVEEFQTFDSVLLQDPLYRVYLGPFLGPRDSGDHDIEISAGPAPLDRLVEVADAGDVDGDGSSDLLVSLAAGSAAASRVCLFYGPLESTLLASDADLCILGASEADWFGQSIAAGEDFNSDGLDDFAIGAPEVPHPDGGSGAVYIFYGQPRLL